MGSWLALVGDHTYHRLSPRRSDFYEVSILLLEAFVLSLYEILDVFLLLVLQSAMVDQRIRTEVAARAVFTQPGSALLDRARPPGRSLKPGIHS